MFNINDKVVRVGDSQSYTLDDCSIGSESVVIKKSTTAGYFYDAEGICYPEADFILAKVYKKSNEFTVEQFKALALLGKITELEGEHCDGDSGMLSPLFLNKRLAVRPPFDTFGEDDSFEIEEISLPLKDSQEKKIH